MAELEDTDVLFDLSCPPQPSRNYSVDNSYTKGKQMDKQDRWQFQPWWVKTCRWLYWKPWHTMIAVLTITWWIATGAKIPDETWPDVPESSLAGKPIWKNRKQVLLFLWNYRQSQAAMDMGQWKTVEECIEDCLDRSSII